MRLDSVKWRYVKISVVGVQLKPWELGGRESPLMFGLCLRDVTVITHVGWRLAEHLLLVTEALLEGTTPSQK